MADGGKAKNVTIGDIAQAAGVSKTTVSRFLSGNSTMLRAWRQGTGA